MRQNKIQTREKTAIVKQIVADNPRVESRKLARLLYAKYPELFPNMEAARMAVRSRRGAAGPVKLRRVKVVGKTPAPSEVLRLPDAIDVPSTPFRVEPGRTLILCDMHFPYHDKRSINAALNEVKGQRIDTILLGGDTADFFSISRYPTDPKERDLKNELETVSEFFGFLRYRFPKARIVWKLGNHEERWAHYLWQKAPEMYGCAFTDLATVTEASRRGIEIVDHRLAVKIGMLTFLHGHELEQGAASPVNPARGVFMRTLDTYAIGHRHRTSEHTEKTANDRFITCWSIGCLCNLSPMYARVNKWNHGFAIVESKADGSFRFHNKRIHDGRVL